MDRAGWDARYEGSELVWTATPNVFVVQEVEPLGPGRAVDLACGEGRNAVWLAERGWQVTAVDFSAVGLDKARRLAEAHGVEVAFVEADVLAWEPPAEGFDLVVVCYLQLPAAELAEALELAARATAQDGTVVVVAHDRENLERGVGGPQDPDVLATPDEVAAALRSAGLVVESSARVARPVATGDGSRDAIDLVVRAVRRSEL